MSQHTLAEIKRAIRDIRHDGDLNILRREMDQRYPGVTFGELQRAVAAIIDDEEQARIEEMQVDKVLAYIFETLADGFPGTATVEDILRHHAARGHKLARKWLAELCDPEAVARVAVEFAAARAHPDYAVLDNADGYGRIDGGDVDASTGRRLVDWYERTFPAESKAVFDSALRAAK